MDATQLAEFIQFGREQHRVEFKGSRPRTDRLFFAKVTRAILGMANTRDGGYVIIGVDEDGSGIVPTGLSDEDAATWTFEALTAGVAEYADPHVELDLRIVVHDEKRFGMVRVEEFAEVPVLCRKTYHNAGAIVLREGACYVRPRRRIETSEIATFSEMRDLLDLAIEKSTRRFVERAYRAGLLISLGAAPPTNDDRFRQQREGF